MKHTIQLKLPKIFGKKEENTEKGPEVKTEVEIDTKKAIDMTKVIGGTLAVGLTIGYIAGLKSVKQVQVTVIK